MTTMTNTQVFAVIIAMIGTAIALLAAGGVIDASYFNRESKFVLIVGLYLICILIYIGDMPDKCEVGETNGDKNDKEDE